MTKQHQRACEAARHWDEYAEESNKRKIVTQKNNSAGKIVIDSSRKGSTRDLLSTDFGVGHKAIEAARRLWLKDSDHFERVAAGLESLPTTKDHDPCVYFIGHKDRPDLPVKIGKANSVAYRRSELQTAHYTELIVLFTLDGYSKLEKTLHRKFANQHVRGEWFSLTQDDLEAIIKEYD